jgi:maltooligosyltrehalose trehalohydrolase
MIEPWSLTRGAMPTRRGTHFSVWAPNASRVSVVIEGRGEHELEALARGTFEGEVIGIGAGAEYRYRLDGKDSYPDPVSRHQPEGVHGPSRVIDPNAFHWKDKHWRGLEMADHIIYEVHVGTFSKGGNFAGVTGHLAELKQLGVTAIEIMPVAEFPGGRNWGYDGVHLYAPQSSYGGPEELRRLVNTAHELGIAVILDCVYNHVGPEGNYLGAYGPYFTETYKTPWGKAANYDGADSDEVRRFVIDNALYWITEFHIDGLRLDAIHGIFDFSARHVLRDLSDAVHAQANALGRKIQIIGESDLNDPKVVRDDQSGYSMDAQWSDDLHHAVHARLTGESKGYYSDFGSVMHIAKALKERFVFDGRFSSFRGRRHGAPATDVSAAHFVVSIQNHDQVGNRAMGDRLSTLVPFPMRKLAAALYLLSPYVPMLFMGEEYDETNPFLYFVSHGDAALVEAVRTGRSEEFKAFGWGDNIPDPAAEETFQRSRLDRTRSSTAEGGAMLSLYRALLKLRREERALRPGDAEVTVEHDEAAAWIRLTLTPRSGVGATLIALFNFAEERRELPLAADGRALRGATRLLATDDPVYVPGGRARGTPETPPATERAVVAPSAAVVFKVEPRPAAPHEAR